MPISNSPQTKNLNNWIAEGSNFTDSGFSRSVTDLGDNGLLHPVSP